METERSATQNRSTEDYVKTILQLQRHTCKVTTSALASSLQVADASITDMMKKLSGRGLVRYKPYQGVTLTPSGKHLALKIVRRHRLWEMFLVTHLGFSWDKIHVEAERLEHATSDELEHRLDQVLGHPAADPHGDPIPTNDGKMKQKEVLCLADCDAKAIVRVRRVSDRVPEILQHAARIGLSLNTRLTIMEKRMFDGSMVIKVGRNHRVVRRELAARIFVESAQPEGRSPRG